jgi:pimeloyl-ACP methyl ester carboxylesterase
MHNGEFAMIRRNPALRILAPILVTFLSACASVERTPVAIQGTEHAVQSASALDGKPLTLFVWEKRRADLDVKSFSENGKVVVLAHGAGTPGHVFYDLQVPGAASPTHSLMDYLAARGYDVFTLDYQNYGRSQGHPCGRCVTTQVAANDIKAVVDYVLVQRSVKQVYLLGWSWGATTTSLFSMQHPDKVRRLVLYAPPTWRGPLNNFPEPTGEFRPVSAERLRNVFTPGMADPAAVDAFVAQATKFRQSPTGVMVDLLRRMPLTDPKLIKVPTMIILGEKDRLTPISQFFLPTFFAELANNDKQFTIVPGAGHALAIETPRARFQLEVLKWFSVDQPGAEIDLTSAVR